MAWSTLSVAQVISEGGLSAAEKAALDAQAGASAATLSDTLTSVIQTVRGVVAASGAEVGAASTVPDSLRMYVVAIVRWRWLIAFPQLRALQTQERKDAAERAEDVLDEVAAGDRRVDPAAAAADASPLEGCAGGQVRIPMVRDDQDADYNAD